MPRILVVDDDPLVCATIRTALETHGYDVVTADGGLNGLRALEATTFDLMIVDIFMPQMNGFESIRLFHERAVNVPLIAISGYVFAEHLSPAPDFLRMALELGASRCLRKPFTASALLGAVELSLSEARTKTMGSAQVLDMAPTVGPKASRPR